MVTAVTLPELLYITIDSDLEWKQWYKSVANKTYVINHDINVWHEANKSQNKCILHTRIKRRFSEWAGSKC